MEHTGLTRSSFNFGIEFMLNAIHMNDAGFNRSYQNWGIDL